MTTASICIIGDEILIGQIKDTNSSNISKELNKHGIKVKSILTIADDRYQIISGINKCLSETNIVITTGGLGPTKDDITKEALSELSGAKAYKESNEQLKILTEILLKRNIEITDINKAQALVPDTCTVIPNKLGTAPCMEFLFPESRYGHKTALYSLPGVPFEAMGILPDVMASIANNFPLQKIIHKTVVTFGIPESVLAKKIETWENSLPDYIKLAYLPNPVIGVRLRLSCYDAENIYDNTSATENREARMEEEIKKLKNILGNAIYGKDEDTLQNILGKLLKSPPEATYQETLSVAESCTGGYISSLITSVPGASAYYKGGIISYSNEVKINLLGVPPEIIEEYSAVSRECVEAMAAGVAKVMDTDYSIATSGIAGPGGGSQERAVGMCWIAAAHKIRSTGEIEIISKRIDFSSSRSVNIERFSSNALNILRTLLNQQLL